MSDIDPPKDIRELKSLLNDPTKNVREMLRRLKDPTEQIRDLKSLIKDPTEALTNARNVYSNFRLQNQAEAFDLGRTVNQYQEYLNAVIHRPQALIEAQRLLFNRLDEASKFAKSIAEMQSFAKKFQTQNQLSIESHREFIAALSREANHLISTNVNKAPSPTDLLKNLVGDDSIAAIMRMGQQSSFSVQVEPDNIVALDAARASAQEIQKSANELLNHPQSIDQEIVQKFEGAVARAIRDAKDPLWKMILIYFIFPLLVSLLTSILTPHITTNMDRRAQTKEIKAQARIAIADKDLLSTMRVVTADILNVRTGASIKADTAGKLHFGSLVIIIEKRRNWTLVEWQDSSSKTKIQGWVFTRYLKPLH